jgi:hypothetical protein
MSSVNTRALTPYDTGEILQPILHPGTTGKVDYDNDESSTILTVSARPTSGSDGTTVDIDTQSDDMVTVVLDGTTVFETNSATVDGEPSDTAYARFGRYVAATLGSSTDWECADMTSEMALFVQNLPGFPAIAGATNTELKLWRGIADELGIKHDVEPSEFGDNE